MTRKMILVVWIGRIVNGLGIQADHHSSGKLLVTWHQSRDTYSPALPSMCDVNDQVLGSSALVNVDCKHGIVTVLARTRPTLLDQLSAGSFAGTLCGRAPQTSPACDPQTA
jgi:hypothetical protein